MNVQYMSVSMLNTPTVEEDQDENKLSCNTVLKKIQGAIKALFTWKVLKPVLWGQGLSLLICGTAITSTYLSNDGISVPLAQSFLNYGLLFIVYTSMLCFKKDENGKPKIITILRAHWWKYILLSIVDVEANFLVVLAYQYTSLTSVQLLDCFILPVVMVLSYWLLKVRYICNHYVGVVVALIGVACMVGADVLVGRDGTEGSGSNPGLGDALVLGGATLYGISNISMEFVTKNHNNGNMEILGMFGLFCPIVCGIQLAILERESLSAIVWNAKVVALFAGFAICMFLLYSLLPIVMKLSSATTVNISLLTADLYALFAGLFLFNDKMSALYVISFITIVVALLVYNSRQPVSRSPTSPEDDDDSASLPSSEEAAAALDLSSPYETLFTSSSLEVF